VSVICWCGIEEEDDNEKKWEVLRTVKYTLFQNGIISSQYDPYIHEGSYCIWVQVAVVSQHPATCNKSVQCCLLVVRNKLRCTTAEIA